MKTLLPKLFNSRLVQAGGLLAIIAAFAASMAWSRPPEAIVKLGGMWVGRYGDITWTGTYTPDPSGLNATVTLQWMTMSAEFQALSAALGADASSIASGSVSVVSTDTATSKLIWYFLKEGTPSTIEPVAGQIKAIAVMVGEWHFTSPTTAVGKHNLKIYLPDAQGSMVPADDTVPFLEFDFDNVPHVKAL